MKNHQIVVILVLVVVAKCWSADLVGDVHVFTNHGGGGYFAQSLIVSDGPGQLSEPDRGKFDINGSSGTASYTLDWARESYSNGTWFFPVIRLEASARKVTYTTDQILSSRVTARHHLTLRLVQRRIDPGEVDYNGQVVSLRGRVAAKGQLSIISADGTPTPEGFAIAGINVGRWGTSNAITSSWSTNQQTTLDLNGWAQPISVAVGGLFTGNYLEADVVANSANYLEIQISQVNISARIYPAGFQVLNSSGALIWEYAKNGDGSPGDKWVLEIVHPQSGLSAGILAHGEPSPFARIRRDINGDALVDFYGILEDSDNLTIWNPLEQLISPYRIVTPILTSRFFRSRTP